MKFSVLPAALRCAAGGIPIFPVGIHKRPLTPHGYHDESANPEVIRGWWQRWPDANYAYRPVHMGCVVLDFDEGAEPLTLPSTFTIQTPSGGTHRYFLTDEAFGNSTPWKGIDVRCANGYVLGPGCCTDKGSYKVIDDREPVPLPADIAAKLREAKSTAPVPIKEPAESPPGAFEAALTWAKGQAK